MPIHTGRGWARSRWSVSTRISCSAKAAVRRRCVCPLRRTSTACAEAGIRIRWCLADALCRCSARIFCRSRSFRARSEYCFPRGHLRAARPARPEFRRAASAACQITNWAVRISVSGADDYAAAVFSRSLLLQSRTEKLAKPIVVKWCDAVLYAVLAAAHFILPMQDIAPLSRIGYYLDEPFLLYLVVQLIPLAPAYPAV